MLNVLSKEHVSKEIKYWVRWLLEREVGALQRCWRFLVSLCQYSFSGSDRKGQRASPIHGDRGKGYAKTNSQ